MPQRFLRPGIRTSNRWNSVSRNAQALYIAILTLVDDFGRYDGRAAVLHGDAFSIWNEQNPECSVTPQHTAALCCELQEARLVHFYEVGGKRCLQMIQWEERIREGAKEKWPKPNESDITQESAADRSVALPPSSPPTPSPTPSPLVASLPIDGEDLKEKTLKPKTPTLEEVRAYALEASLPVSDADWFWHKCEGNGWTNGGQKIKSWKHTVAAWKAAGYLPSQKIVSAHKRDTSGSPGGRY